MKRNHTKLRALIKVDAKENVGALGTIIESIDTPSPEPLNVLGNRSLNGAYGQFLFGGDFGDSDVSDLFEALLSKLPPENADDLRKLFLLSYFEGAEGAGRWLAGDLLRIKQSADGRRGGKKTGRKHAETAKTKWQDEALLIAQEIERQNPESRQPGIAKKIMAKMGDRAPSEKQVKTVVSGWRKIGLLKEVRAPRKAKEADSAEPF
jgi:hypothetical protein